ncbi:hypothetical protein C7212DRAFT_345449 [Tuber magnatum]|uniref:Uncharacterized protein n=1 Tax=Tuber magnatum TaxID=42249 RepID=A0A317SMR3_9PEZI|nr:hypothetical protein C7212DRAFT_345449 [Tuber magnatum]
MGLGDNKHAEEVVGDVDGVVGSFQAPEPFRVEAMEGRGVKGKGKRRDRVVKENRGSKAEAGVLAMLDALVEVEGGQAVPALEGMDVDSMPLVLLDMEERMARAEGLILDLREDCDILHDRGVYLKGKKCHKVSRHIVGKPLYAMRPEKRILFANIANKGKVLSGDGFLTVGPGWVAKKGFRVGALTEQNCKVNLNCQQKRNVMGGFLGGVKSEMVRNQLNKALSDLNVANLLFAKTAVTRFGDLHPVMANAVATGLVGYFLVPREVAEEMGMGRWEFRLDTPKIEPFIGGVPLEKALGRKWEVDNWVGEMDRMAVDVEISNPGVHVVARPAWASKLGALQARGVVSAGLMLVVEKMAEVVRMLGQVQLMLCVAGLAMPVIVDNTSVTGITDKSCNRVPIMRVNISASNVGASEGNRRLVFDVFSYVDVVFMLDPPVGSSVVDEEYFVSGSLIGFMSVIRRDGQGANVMRKVEELCGLVNHVIGDINGGHRKWGSLADTVENSQGMAMLRGFIETFKFAQRVGVMFRGVSVIDIYASRRNLLKWLTLD